MIGYLVSSHVLQNHAIIPPLLASMAACGIEPERIVVVVNGSGQRHDTRIGGVRFIFQQPEFASHFEPVLTHDLPFTHLFFINGTSRCGSRFKFLVEKGFDPEADCTLAGALLPLGNFGTEGRAINDLCCYRTDYLLSEAAIISEMSRAGGSTRYAIKEMEGVLFALAPRKAHYPVIGHEDSGPTDVYRTGTLRITEYYEGIDWYRFKRNHGQLAPGSFKAAAL